MVVESTGRHGPSGDAPELIEEIARPGISRRLAGVWLASALMTGLVWPIGSALSSDQASESTLGAPARACEVWS